MTSERAVVLQTEDGLFMRSLPSELLRKLNIVDTPGTNVIIDRQQRLTEEFVPRSDLVLFIMSADRAFTESEVRTLRRAPAPRCHRRNVQTLYPMCRRPASSGGVCFRPPGRLAQSPGLRLREWHRRCCGALRAQQPPPHGSHKSTC